MAAPLWPNNDQFTFRRQDLLFKRFVKKNHFWKKLFTVDALFSAHNSSTLREMCGAVENSPQIKFCRFLQRKTSKYRKYLALDEICSDGLKEENSLLPYHRISRIFCIKWVGDILIWHIFYSWELILVKEILEVNLSDNKKFLECIFSMNI